VHFIEVATTHWLGGQHGEEGKGEEETREEGKAESEALRRIASESSARRRGLQRLIRFIAPALIT
jgi:hypothetical protein